MYVSMYVVCMCLCTDVSALFPINRKIVLCVTYIRNVDGYLDDYDFSDNRK